MEQARIRVRIETITPELAAKWLEQNTTNRVLRQERIDTYARDMAAGCWHMTGEAIMFGASGRLLNGQHRLWACILADAPFESVVVRGIVNEDEVMDVIDTGLKRTLANALQIHGEKDGNVLAAIISLCWRYERRTPNGGGLPRVYPTHAEGLRWLVDNPDARVAVSVARKARAIRVPTSASGAAFYLNSRVDADAADEFWALAVTGEGLPSGSPILAYRRWVIGSLAKRDKPSPETWFNYNLKAMSLWKAGKKTTLLAVKPDETSSAWK